jgi:hypothetical protein
MILPVQEENKMQLLAVRTARVLAFFNAEELNPAGRAIAHDYLKGFIERYGFLKYPQKIEDMDEDKGIHFETGKWNNIGIERVALFSWGVVVDTNASTDTSEAILKDILDWGAEKFGTSNRPDLITRKAYLSELIFTSDISLNAINPKIQALSSKITDSISKHFHQQLDYEIGGIALHFDTRHSKQLFAAFKVERLENTPYPDNKYYSGAQLPTKEHIALLNEFEAALRE